LDIRLFWRKLLVLIIKFIVIVIPSNI
jgi:hypothetical protein